MAIIIDQLETINSNTKKYTINAVLNAFTIYLYSSSCYNIIRDQNILILPHPKTLQKISALQDINANNEPSNNKYFSKVVENLSKTEKIVNIQIDEIYVKSKINFKSNNLIGYAENSNNIAKTMLCFMINSIYGPMKEIVKLIPVYNINGQQQCEYTKNVINFVQSIGFKVLTITTDNNRVNQNMFRELSPNNTFKFPNPMVKDEDIFLIFDSVHIIKNIRNNWLNKSDAQKTFYYPNMIDGKIQLACFNDLREFHKKESHLLVKKAYKLNTKSLHPTHIERQNVQLALNVFHTTTIAALKTVKPQINYSGTVDFLSIINEWWKIISNKQPYNGIRQITDLQVTFLENFVEWLLKWKNLNLFDGCLTRDTFDAIFQTTSVILIVIKKSLLDIGVEYFLPGKLQTEDLEGRFAKYRRLSGCTYFVSAQEILECEKKLRIRKSIKHYFEGVKTGNPYRSLHDMLKVDVSKFVSLLETPTYLEKFGAIFDKDANFYICGYAAHSIVINKDLKCKQCIELIKEINDNTSATNDYFDLINQGGLSISSPQVEYILFHMNGILLELNENYKVDFMRSSDQKGILISLTYLSLLSEKSDIDFDIECSCGRQSIDIYIIVFSIMSNILLSNYSKKLNEELIDKKTKPQLKRKIEVFKKSK